MERGLIERNYTVKFWVTWEIFYDFYAVTRVIAIVLHIICKQNLSLCNALSSVCLLKAYSYWRKRGLHLEFVRTNYLPG